jgi:predicted Zn-dependent protease
MRILLLLVVALAVALAACEGPTMPPALLGDLYEFRLPTTPVQVLRWESGARVRIHVTPSTGARAGVLEGALARALVVWNREALYGEYELVQVASLNDADVVVRWSDEVPPVDMSECPPDVSRAVTTFCLDESGDHLEPFPHTGGTNSVRMVVSVLGSEAARADRVERLVAHELGHVLGIARHSLDAGDLMYGGELTRATLSTRDAATIRVLYHTRPDITP